jgi:hypothetical protein
LWIVPTRTSATSTAISEIDARGTAMGKPGIRRSGNRAAGTTNHLGTRAEKVKGSETRRCATVNFGKDVTDSHPATRGHVTRIATMTMTAVAGVGGGDAAVTARTVAAVAPAAGA